MRPLRLLLLLFAGLLLMAQDTANFHYQAIYTTTNSQALTVQTPATGARQGQFESAWVRCSAACTFTISQNGTAATATTLATKPLNVPTPSTWLAWSASNVGAGTTLATYYLEAAGTFVIDMHGFYLGTNAGTAQNLTITNNTATNATIVIQWMERQ